jgi:hypothetical protein
VPPNPGWFTLVGEKPAPLGVIPAIRSSIPRISLGSRRRLKGNMHLAASLSFRSQGRGPVHRRPGRQLQSRSNRVRSRFLLMGQHPPHLQRNLCHQRSVHSRCRMT